MDFKLSNEQSAFQDSVRNFALKNLKEGALKRAHTDGYPSDVAKLMAANGLFGIPIAEQIGGQGGSLFDAVLAIEEIALVCPRSGDIIQSGNFGAIRVLSEFATEYLRKKYLSPLLRGEGLIATAMTEPDAGSSATDLTTTATEERGDIRINGSKIFTTHGMDASVFLAYVRFGPGVSGIGSVLIDREAEGLTFGKPSRFLSGEHWHTLHFDNVRIPVQNVLLGPGAFKKQIHAFNVERLGNSARSLSLGRYAFETAREYAKTRRQFGRPLCEFQGLQWKFAKMKMELNAAQLLLYRAAVSSDQGLPSAEETAIAKAYCNRAGFEAANESMQIMGGMGYSEEMLVEYCFRRTRGWMIAGGSMEMMLNRIAESIFERPFSQRPPVAVTSANAPSRT